jgi:pullulanase
MSRFALLVWVLSPLLIIAALALMMDRSKGRPDARLQAVAAARLPGQAADSPRSEERLARERAETEAREIAQGLKPAPKPEAAPTTAPPTGMVQPESLPQGFIIVVDDTTKGASDASPIYLASSHNGWNPADPAMKLTRRSDMKWQIVLPKPTLDSRMAFKFARGATWDLVEVDPDGKDIENRMLPAVDASKLGPGEKPVLEFAVPRWKDAKAAAPGASDPYRPIKVSAGTLRRVEVTGGGGDGTQTRDLLVWLPPGYDDAANAARRYPVLYMQDGQNLFEKHGAIPAEWGVDETAARLIEEKAIEPLIVVGIPHAGAARMSEYAPVAMMDGVPPTGKRYIEFLLKEVKPRVDALFRTNPDAASTGIGGSSLGAAIAIEAATEHPEVFGKVLAESTPMTNKDRALFRYFAAKKTWPARIYFGMGGKELPNDPGTSAQLAASAQAFGELLKGKGFTGETLKIVVDPEAAHDEQAWAKRLPEALRFLFPPK